MTKLNTMQLLKESTFQLILLFFHKAFFLKLIFNLKNVVNYLKSKCLT